MTPGLVSTVIPVHNRPAMLADAVASVLAQDWRPIEIIVVDDGSTDDTPQAAQALQRAHPGIMHVIRQDNGGPGRARQRGLEAARGEFIQFLDSDDVLLPGKFERQVRGLMQDPDAGISYGKSYARVEGRRLPEPTQQSGRRERHILPAALNMRLWDTGGPLYRRTALQRIGPWSDLRQLEDWEFDCRAGAAGILLHHCDEFVHEYIHHTEPRLGLAWMRDESAMHDRIRAYVLVYGHAKRAGVARESAEMRTFVRSLFWMARNAASYGLTKEARELFQLARAEAVNPGLDYAAFAMAGNVMGWQRAARLAEAVRRWRA
jgi:glycosyltransferase involved in cell wall biosynthesis